MKNNLSIFLPFLLSIAFFSSCKKDTFIPEVEEELFSITDAAALAKFNFDALIVIRNENAVLNYLLEPDGQWSIPKLTSVYGFSLKTKKEISIDQPTMQHTRFFEQNSDINQNEIKYKSPYDVFGKKVTVSVDKGKLFERTLQLPLPLFLRAPRPDSSSLWVPLDRQKGDIIRWNKDPNNKKGVVIYLSYDDPKDEEKSTKNMIVATHVTPDNGSFTVTPEMIAKIPKDYQVIVKLVRGRYELVPKAADGLNYLIMGATTTNFRYAIAN